jgi:hypothetical protein
VTTPRVRPSRLALVVLLALVGACARAGAVELRYRPPVGETSRYRLLIAARVDTTSPTKPSYHRQAEALVNIAFAQMVRSQSDTTTTVETQLLTGKATITVAGREIVADLGRGSALTAVDLQGVVLDEESDIEEPLDDFSEEVFLTLEEPLGVLYGGWTDLLWLLRLPEGDVQIGAEWQQSEDSQTSQLVRTYRLAELTAFQGRKCAKIEGTWQGHWSATHTPDGPGAQQIGPMSSEGTDKGELIWYLDLERHRIACMEGRFEGALAATASAGSSVDKTIANVKLIPAE